MMSAYLDHARSLEELHATINTVDPGTMRDAASNLVGDVENAIEEIENHTRIILSAIHSKAAEARRRIDAETGATVSSIKKETTSAAATLLRRSKGLDEKSAARAAGKILEEASVLSNTLYRKSKDAFASIARDIEVAATDVNGLRDDAIRNLAEIAQNAINRLANQGDDKNRRNLASGSNDELSGVRIEATREVLADAKKALIEAADKVNRTIKDAYDRLNKCARDAIERVEKAAQEATAAIESAVDDAKGKLLEATEVAISKTDAAAKVDHFNLDALKKRGCPS